MNHPEKNNNGVEGKEALQRAIDTQDLVEKEFIGFPDISADILNVLLYRGRNIIKEENLLSGPTEIIYQGHKKLRSQYEDLCKYDMADGKIHIMYLIANQSKTDGKMLLRKAGYTGGIYREQREADEVKVCELFDQYERRGRAQGKVEGKAEGRIEGETRFARLLQMLIESERGDDLKRAVSDPNYRNQLYMEAGLV